MLVVIPTFRRNQYLHWVLRAVAQCEVKDIPERVRILVVNNYPPARDEVEATVAGFKPDLRFDWKVLGREKSLDPVDNWYSAILSEAHPDEVVILLGDDDILPPWSLVDRFASITEFKADMLLSYGAAGRVYYFEQGEKVYYPRPLPAHRLGLKAHDLKIANMLPYGAIGIWTHCYRFTAHFKAGLEKAFAWCDELTWADRSNRTLMLPEFLPVAITRCGGRVIGLDHACALRGGEVGEITKAPFGSHGWNSALIALLALHIYRNRELADDPALEGHRHSTVQSVIEHLPSLFLDSRVDPAMRRRALSGSFKASWLLSPLLLRGVRRVAAHYLRLTGWTLRRISEAQFQDTEEFLTQLRGIHR